MHRTSAHNKELPGPNVIGSAAEKPRVRKITAFFFSQPLYSLGFVLSSANGFLCCFLDKLGNDWPNSSASFLSNVTFKLSHPNSTQYTLSLFPISYYWERDFHWFRHFLCSNNACQKVVLCGFLVT